MLDKLKLFYPSVPEEMLEAVAENVQSFALDYCNLEECPQSMGTLLFKMAQEDINKMYAEGFSSESVGGNSTSYTECYSPDIYKRLNKHKRIRLG